MRHVYSTYTTYSSSTILHRGHKESQKGVMASDVLDAFKPSPDCNFISKNKRKPSLKQNLFDWDLFLMFR